ncbi:MAG: S8 family serine peptidase [Myxococcales bacterium]|nr:S8 family serine peptidase [Myxococcales bacterium]
MLVSRERLVLALASVVVSAQVSSAQVDSVDSVAGLGALVVERVRDGAEWLDVRRDDAHPRRVFVSRADGVRFAATIDEHALVRVAPDVDAVAAFRALGVRPVSEVARAIGAWRVVDIGGEDGLGLAARLAPHAGPGGPLVDAIPDWILAHELRAIDIPPNDPRYPGQWFFSRIDLEAAWRMSIGDESVTVVVVDTGCDGEHPDLVAKLDPGRDVLDGDDDPTPPEGPGAEHGTACAGLVGAETDNGLGVAGACPLCRVRCVRLLSGMASEVPISADVAAFQFALDVDAAIVSNSWGFVNATPIPAALRAILERVSDEGRGGRGALVLFAAGNDDRELYDYELNAVRGVITVGAVNNFDEVTAFSNRGPSVALVAPTGTLTTDISGPGGADPGDYLASFGGTSSACPIAAGVAGLLVAAAPEATREEIADALIFTARQSIFATPDERGHDLYYGYGRLDPAAALRRILGGDGADDGGHGEDAGIEPEPDAGSAPLEPSGGCGCHVASPLEGAAGLLGLLAFLRRRR